MENQIFKGPDARKKLDDWYQRFQKKIQIPVESEWVETRYGSNHVLVAGDKENPPLICLHAMLTGSSHLLSELQLLAKHYRLIAPDLPGQSVRGIESRFSYKNDDFSNWLIDIADSLELQKMNLLGVSLGGFAATKYAIFKPNRVNKLILIVPAGFVNGSFLKGMIKLAVPGIMYRLKPSAERLRAFTEPLLSTWDKDWAGYLGDSSQFFRPDLRIPPLFTDEEILSLKPGTLLIAAEEDLSFPGRAMVERLESLRPDIQTELLAGAKHSPPTTDPFRTWLSGRVHQFIQQS